MTAWKITRCEGQLELCGELRIANAAAIWSTLQRLSVDPGVHLDLDLGRITAIDGAIMALLVDVRRSSPAEPRARRTAPRSIVWCRRSALPSTRRPRRSPSES